jgi:hypothetical protein
MEEWAHGVDVTISYSKKSWELQYFYRVFEPSSFGSRRTILKWSSKTHIFQQLKKPVSVWEKDFNGQMTNFEVNISYYYRHSLKSQNTVSEILNRFHMNRTNDFPWFYVRLTAMHLLQHDRNNESNLLRPESTIAIQEYTVLCVTSTLVAKKLLHTVPTRWPKLPVRWQSQLLHANRYWFSGRLRPAACESLIVHTCLCIL